MDYRNRLYPNMLRVIRQNAGYQQRQVAKLLGHNSAATLCDWENEKRMPSGTNLIKLCILYNKTPKDLYPEFYHQMQRHLTNN